MIYIYLQKTNYLIKVIVIEDHPIVIFNLQQGLNQYNDICMLNALSRGKEVLEYMAFDEAHVILLDINLPDMNGFDICTYLKAKYPHIKIIGLSSYEDVEYIRDFLDCGADGYLVKGASNTIIYSAIKQVETGTPYLCEIATKRLSNNESLTHHQNIHLTSQETKIIELSKIKPSLSFISEEIQEQKNVISTVFKSLRNKIDEHNLPVTLPKRLEA